MKAESKIITIRLPVWMVEELDEDAHQQRVNRTEFIKRLYLDYKESEADMEEYIKFMAATEAAERD